MEAAYNLAHSARKIEGNDVDALARGRSGGLGGAGGVRPGVMRDDSTSDFHDERQFLAFLLEAIERGLAHSA